MDKLQEAQTIKALEMRKATILAAETSCFYFVIFKGVSIYVINALNDQEECLSSVGMEILACEKAG